jgi:hypothetical protein
VPDLTPVPFSPFLAIYARVQFCQSIQIEAFVRAKHQAIRIGSAASLVHAVLTCVSVLPRAESAMPQANSSYDTAIAALCPIIYPDDQSPASRGYHYTFFGNAFFINEEGYLLTVAHVLETFRGGGQPYILANRPNAPPQLLHVAIIARDAQHDVAILRAVPNPFAGKNAVSVMPLNSEPAVRGQAVTALSLRPKRLQDAHSFEYELEVSSPGTVLSFESTQLDKSGHAADVFLLSHPVEKGQSGSPVIETKTQAAVGVVEGLWLRGASLPLGKKGSLPKNTPGAAIPIRYAITLLQQQGLAWHSAGSLPAPPASSQAVHTPGGRPR